MHLCAHRVDVDKGRRLSNSPGLSATLKMASVIVFAAAPKEHNRFFWSPVGFKVSPPLPPPVCVTPVPHV